MIDILRKKRVRARKSKYSKKPQRKSLRYLLSLLAFIVFTGTIFFGLRISQEYANINFQGEGEVDSWNGEKKINVVLIGLDKKDTGYSFVDLAMVVVIDPKSKDVGIFAIDPDIQFQTRDGKDTSIRKGFNQGGRDEVIYGIEQVIAIEIDKYVISDKGAFLEMDKVLGPFEVDIVENISDPDVKLREYKSGEIYGITAGNHTLNAEETLRAISADESGMDNKLDAQGSLIRNKINHLGNIFAFGKLVYNLSDLSVIETNFEKWDLVKLTYFFSGLNSSDVRYGYTRQVSLFPENKSLGSGKRVEYQYLDQDIQSIFFDQNVAKEQARVEVLNGTDKSGLATRYSRYFKNTGIRVVRNGNAIQKSQDTILFVEKGADYPETVEQIKMVFNGKIKVVEQEYKYKHIGDMVLVVGRDTLGTN